VSVMDYPDLSGKQPAISIHGSTAEEFVQSGAKQSKVWLDRKGKGVSVLVEAESSFAGSRVNQLASLSSTEDLIKTKEEKSHRVKHVTFLSMLRFQA
jgi:tRNA threonylcarbamoyladenosine modification (KEOPS) complex  Pcc1 subunit